MRGILIIAIAAFLLFGCVGEPAKGPPSGPTDNVTEPEEPGEVEVEEECEPFSYSFSKLESGVLSEATSLVATVTCGKGKELAVKLDGETVATKTVISNAATPVGFDVVAIKDGTVKLTVEADGEVIHSRDWVVDPLGNADISTNDYDPVSHKEWRAMAFEVENQIDLSKVRIFMKRLDAQTVEGNMIVAEIRNDANGKPGSLVRSVEHPIEATTLSQNWLAFDFSETLKAGRYWVVLKVDKAEGELISDVVNVYYTTIDRFAEGNEYTLVMKLDVDEKTGDATETVWQPLSYDREYVIVLSSK